MKPAVFRVLFRHLIALLALALLASSVGCGSAPKTGILTVRDDARGRTKRLDPRNKLDGTPKTSPAWANPGVYFYDDNSTVFFVELKVRNNNVPMKLKGASLIVGGNRLFLNRCSPVVEEVSEEGATKVYTETSECRLEKEVFKQIGDAPEVRIIYEGDKERSAVFSGTNRQRFQKFFALVTKPKAE